MQNNYLTEDAKKELITVLTNEYEKILISETISKSNKSAMEKQQIAEIINYLQNNENITYADLCKLNESYWKEMLGKIGKKVLGPLGIVWDVVDGGLQLYDVLTKPLPKLPQPLPSPVDFPRPEVPGLAEAPEYPQLAEIVNYLQNSENVTYADLIELCEARKAGLGWLGRIGKWLGVPALEEIGSPLMPMDFGIPIPDPFVGPGGAGGGHGHHYHRYPNPDELDPDFVGPVYYGSDDPLNEPGYFEPGGPAGPAGPPSPGNLPESMKAFWKNRLVEKINYK